MERMIEERDAMIVRRGAEIRECLSKPDRGLTSYVLFQRKYKKMIHLTVKFTDKTQSFYRILLLNLKKNVAQQIQCRSDLSTMVDS